jgi:hypothetical protein
MQRVGTPDKNLVLFCSCSPQHITGISSKFHPIVPFLLPLHENKKIAKKQEKEEETNKETNKEKEKETKKETKKEKEAVAFFRVLQLSQSLSDCQILYMFTSVYVFRQPHVIHLENVKMFASYLKAFPTVDKIACFSILLTKYSQQEILSFFISLFQHNVLFLFFLLFFFFFFFFFFTDTLSFVDLVRVEFSLLVSSGNPSSSIASFDSFSASAERFRYGNNRSIALQSKSKKNLRFFMGFYDLRADCHALAIFKATELVVSGLYHFSSMNWTAMRPLV